MTNSNGLTVDFCGDLYRLEAPDERTFGRQGDISIDDNPHLHRVLGRFVRRSELWWIINEGRHIGLEVCDRDGQSTTSIAPSTSAPLLYQASAVRFEAGSTRYELLLDLDAAPTPTPSPCTSDHTDSGDKTMSVFDIPMTEDQRALVVAVARPILRGLSMPTSRELAVGLGWSQPKFDRKLDNVCEKLDRHGIGGLLASSRRLPKSRKERLAEYAIESGLVTSADLGD